MTVKEVVGGVHVVTNAGFSQIVSEILIKSEVEVDCGTPTDRAWCTWRLAGRAQNVQPVTLPEGPSVLSRTCLCTNHACYSCHQGPEVGVISQELGESGPWKRSHRSCIVQGPSRKEMNSQSSLTNKLNEEMIYR